MRSLLKGIWYEDGGVLTFEWVLLITVIVIGIVGGYAATRDAVIDELGDIAGAVIAVDQSFTTPNNNQWGSFDDDDNPQVTRQRP